jgi:hypothetical protein
MPKRKRIADKDASSEVDNPNEAAAVSIAEGLLELKLITRKNQAAVIDFLLDRSVLTSEQLVEMPFSNYNDRIPIPVDWTQQCANCANIVCRVGSDMVGHSCVVCDKNLCRDCQWNRVSKCRSCE